MRVTAKIPGRHPISVGERLIGHLIDPTLDGENGCDLMHSGTKDNPSPYSRFLQTGAVRAVLKGEIALESFHEIEAAWESRRRQYIQTGQVQEEPEIFVTIGDRSVRAVIGPLSWGNFQREEPATASIGCLTYDPCIVDPAFLQSVGANDISLSYKYAGLPPVAPFTIEVKTNARGVPGERLTET